ncbi:hypothetical protein FPE53_22670 [Salmonella enterica subsp. enterica]|uniref:Conjugal transfer protein TraP n=1 Tax=Salmonella enterica subsp. enterica serovar Aqua TaxID=1302615 RepID=A0A5X6EQV8_SALET|nr:hypothetical protein [Salmonella enterica subsp. enterica serovar Aqua]ECH1172006.1 hypothetical protein [Salmonella enterica subsp. enterica serovar Aqua]HCM8927686.1 hypothetical protein [Salmonella enterica subsp. enterica serovar Paratyphi B]
MKPHFDPELPAPEPLDDSEMKAEEPVISSGKPTKRPLWDQPKVQIAALAILAILGLTWKMSGSSTAGPTPPKFATTEQPGSPQPLRVDAPPVQEPVSDPEYVPPVQTAPVKQAPSETDSLASEVSRALNSQQVYSEKTREGLTALSGRLDRVEQQLSELQGQRQRLPSPPPVRQTVVTPVKPDPVPKTRKTSSGRSWSGHNARINSLYPGLAWVTWKGSSWALRPGDRFAGATVLRIDESRREVVTSSGVIR